MQETIKIAGITFKISQSWTLAKLEEHNYHALIAEFQKNGIKRQIYASRLNGKRLFVINEYLNGSFSGYQHAI